MIKFDAAEGKLKLPDKTGSSWADAKTRNWLDKLYLTDWVVYCKKPFKNVDTVIEYLSRYTHKTALYNNRLVAMDDHTVSFNWKDYRDGNRRKVMTLESGEFLRRFMIHVLPSGFQRIRHYGILSNRNRNSKLKTCFKLLKKNRPERKKLTAQEMILLTKGIDITKCKDCGGHWQRIYSIFPQKS